MRLMHEEEEKKEEEWKENETTSFVHVPFFNVSNEVAGPVIPNWMFCWND